MLLKELGEFGFISRIGELLGADKNPQVVLGVGDDGAIWRPTMGRDLVFSCDTQVEGRHFLRLGSHPWQTAEGIGRRCAAVNLSDLAAMGASPCFALVSLGVSSSLEVGVLEDLYRGLLSTLRAAGASVIGGNMTSTEGPMFVDLTIAGEVAPGRSVRRDGAQVGDLIGVLGYPGRSAAGLRCLEWMDGSLEAGRGEEWRGLCDAYLAPKARLAEALALAPWLHSLIDLSDGLLSDLSHLLETVGLGARLVRERLPVCPELERLCVELGCDPFDFVLGASDDYELLFCAPPEHRDAIERTKEEEGFVLHWIGEVVSDVGLVLDEGGGQGKTLEAVGWEHFPREGR